MAVHFGVRRVSVALFSFFRTINRNVPLRSSKVVLTHRTPNYLKSDTNAEYDSSATPCRLGW